MLPTDLKTFQRAILGLMLGLLACLVVGVTSFGWPLAPAWLVVLAQTLLGVHAWSALVPSGPSARLPYAGALLAGVWAGGVYAVLYDLPRGAAYGAALALLLALGQWPLRRSGAR
jgi:hypothetical protein